jgi:hypothetical protein
MEKPHRIVKSTPIHSPKAPGPGLGRGPRPAYRWVRKALGVSCAGGLFTAIGLALMFELPQRALAGMPLTGPAACFAVFWSLVFASSLFTLPFDWLSHRAGRGYGRVRSGERAFGAAWARGVALQMTLLPAFAVLIHASGRAGGDTAAMTMFTAILVLMYLVRTELSRFIIGYQFRIFTFESVGELRKGPERMRLIVTLLWNQSAFACALAVPDAGAATVPGMVVTIFAFSCFSLMGWLFLPWLGRGHRLGTALLALDLSWAGANLITRSVCTNVGIPRKWIACEEPSRG